MPAPLSDVPSVGELLQVTGAITAALYAAARIASLWTKSRKDAVDAHDQRFADSWKRQGELLDDAQAECDRLRAEVERYRTLLADCWQDKDRRRSPRSRS